MLHLKSLRSALAPELPNLRAIVRDRAHNSRYLSARSFAVDPVLQEPLDLTSPKTALCHPADQGFDALRQICVAESQCHATRDDFINTVTNMPLQAIVSTLCKTIGAHCPES